MSREVGAGPARYGQDGDAGPIDLCFGMSPVPNFGFGSNERCSYRGLQTDDELLHGGIRKREEPHDAAGDVLRLLFEG